eukprot:TRINITY_DN200_c0_g4_i1.p1 TRINITY_DN200_c0_g4~~TRINITY_DN200_c0_g4_i1.p1  ORF type:complete len:768 (+),score=185.91 TRINITY_DN200_c0_g4_i1:1018-3321(+)
MAESSAAAAQQRAFSQALVLCVDHTCGAWPRVLDALPGLPQGAFAPQQADLLQLADGACSLRSLPPPMPLSAVVKNATACCFPDIEAIVAACKQQQQQQLPCSESKSVFFTNMITDEEHGVRQYGHTRRFMVPGVGHVCICLISSFSWFSVFRDFLVSAEEHFRSSPVACHDLLQSFFMSPVPYPGGFITLALTVQKSCQSPPLARPNDTTVPATEDCYLLVQKFGTKLIFLFSALLLERRILFLGSDMEKISKCAHAAVGTLYPFAWQHYFIPIVSYSKMTTYLDSPITGFIIGIVKSNLSSRQRVALKDVVVADVDTGEVTYSSQLAASEDMRQMPQSYLQVLRYMISTAEKDITLGAYKNQTLMDAFRSFFVKLFGNYHRFLHVITDTANNKTVGRFDRTTFIKSHLVADRPFIQAFCATTMFAEFITKREELATQKRAPVGQFEADALLEYPPDVPKVGGLSSLSEKAKGVISKVANPTFPQLRGALEPLVISAPNTPSPDLAKQQVAPHSGSPITNGKEQPEKLLGGFRNPLAVSFLELHILCTPQSLVRKDTAADQQALLDLIGFAGPASPRSPGNAASSPTSLHPTRPQKPPPPPPAGNILRPLPRPIPPKQPPPPPAAQKTPTPPSTISPKSVAAPQRKPSPPPQPLLPPPQHTPSPPYVLPPPPVAVKPTAAALFPFPHPTTQPPMPHQQTKPRPRPQAITSSNPFDELDPVDLTFDDKTTSPWVLTSAEPPPRSPPPHLPPPPPSSTHRAATVDLLL